MRQDLPSPEQVECYYRVRFGIELSRKETRARCPVHRGQGLNLSINADTGFAKCHSGCQKGWDIYSLEGQLAGCNFPDAKRRVQEIIGGPTDGHANSNAWPGRQVAVFDYTTVTGELLYQNVRYEPGENGTAKTFRQRSPRAGGGWSPTVKGIARVPFQLPIIAAADRCAVTEGEKDALAVTRLDLGFPGTCNSGGAGSWTEGEAGYLYGKRSVVIFGDNDEPGRKFVKSVASSLAGRVGSLRVVPVPEQHKDISEWIESGATAADIALAIEAAVEWGASTPMASTEETVNWRDSLIVTEKGAPRGLLANAIAAFRGDSAWSGILQYSEFALSTYARGRLPWDSIAGERPWTNRDDLLAAEWLQQEGIHVSPEVASQAVEVVAGDRPFHPVRDYLQGLTWDGTRRLDRWLVKHLGAQPSDYAYAVGARWAISAVARVMRPGCKADCVLIPEAPQGSGKSTAIRTLAGDRFYTDEIADLGSKDAAMQTRGAWIIEISELDAMSRGEVSKIKAFISRSTDRFRPPYGRRVIESPRQCVFAGTVNHEAYLRDETGARRFWPVRCARIDVHQLARDRDQLWAEAFFRFKRGDAWWLDNSLLTGIAETEQQDRYAADPWDAGILEYAESRSTVSVEEILTVLKVDRSKWTPVDSNRVARCLKANRWDRYQQRDGERRIWRYRRPAPDSSGHESAADFVSPLDPYTGDRVVTE